MSVAAVLAPVFVQIALTFGLLLWLGAVRLRALREKELHIRDVERGESRWPAPVTQIQNAYENQFELPVLFYVLVGLALVAGHATTTLVVLSWLFVVCRLGHALIHTTTNNVPPRFFAYCAGLAVLMVMWIWFLAVVAFA